MSSQSESDLEYARLSEEFRESEKEEYEAWLEGWRKRGIVMCQFDDVPCNMIFSTVDKLVCKGVFKKGACAVPTMYVCGRHLLRGSSLRGGSVYDEVVRQNLLEVAFRKCSDLCFFDHEKCGSAGLFIGGDFPNGCFVEPEVHLDKSLSAGAPWFCVRIRFGNGSVSVGEALVCEGGE